MRAVPRGRIRKERLTFGHHGLQVVPNWTPAAVPVLANEPQPVRLLRIETWDWAWGGLLMFSILLFIRPQDQISRALGSAHLSDIAAFIGLVGMLVVNLSRGKAVFRMTPEVLGVFGLGALMLLLAPFSIWPGGVLSIVSGMYIQVMLIFLLMVNAVTSPKRLERICRVIVISFGLITLRVCLDYFRGTNLVEGNRASGPADAFFGNPNDLALNLVAFLPLVLMYVRRPAPLLSRAMYAGIGLVMCAALVFTKSRGGFIGFVAMAATYLLVARLLTPGVIVGLLLGGLLIVPVVPSSFWDRMASITDSSKDTTGSRQERVELMKQAWRVFEANPLTGIGAGQFENYQEPGQVQHWRVTHNTLLQLGSEMGIFGVLTMMFLFVRGTSGAWRTHRQLTRGQRRWRRHSPAPEEDGLEPAERAFLREQSAAMVACMVGWFVAALFAAVAYNWTFYYLLGLCVAGRQVTLARAKAYARARSLGQQEIVAA